MTTAIDVRVLVAFDCAHPSAEVLQQLPRLLGSEQLELTGLYLEDEDLLQAARLPGLREILLSGQELELNLERLQQDMADDLARIRSAFEAIARQLRLRCRFEIARGRVGDTLSAAATQSDFVLISRTLRTSGLRPRFGGAFGPVLRDHKRVLFVNEPWASGRSVIVLGQDPEALAAAQRLAHAEGLALIIALPVAGPLPYNLPSGSQVVRLADWTEDTIANLCVARDARLLVVPGAAGLDTSDLLAQLLDRLPCSLLKLG